MIEHKTKNTPWDAEATNKEFDSIVGSLTIVDERESPENNRITVMVDMPHVRKYGHRETTRELVYGCSFPVKKGDTVLCPPTPRNKKWSTGVVVSLDGRGYKGRVKYVKKNNKKEQ